MRSAAAVPILGLGMLLVCGSPGQAQEFVINVPKLIHAEPAAETAFPIPVGPPDALPRNAFLRIRGLPRTATLSGGRQIVGGAWAVPLSALSTLKITIPVGYEGRADIAISLETAGGRVLTQTQSTLQIAPAALLSSGQPQRSPEGE